MQYSNSSFKVLGLKVLGVRFGGVYGLGGVGEGWRSLPEVAGAANMR